MKLKRKFTQGNKTLEHHRYTDDFGVLRDSMQVVVTEESGHKVITPIRPPIKVTTHSKNDNILDDTNEYTDEDYSEMLK